MGVEKSYPHLYLTLLDISNRGYILGVYETHTLKRRDRRTENPKGYLTSGRCNDILHSIFRDISIITLRNMSLKQNDEYMESKQESLSDALLRNIERMKKINATPATHIAELLQEPTAEEIDEVRDAEEDRALELEN